MPGRISVILLSLALLCGLGSRAAWTLPAQPFTLHGNLTVDGTQLKQNNPYFTQYVVFITVEGQAGTIFSYKMGHNPSDEYWLIMPMSAGDREQATIQTGDTVHIFVDIDDNPDNGNEAEAKESPYAIGMPGDDVLLNISCSIASGQPTNLTAILGADGNDEPDFGKIALSWTASGNDGDMRTVDGYEGIVSSEDPGNLTGQDLENWWANASNFDASGWTLPSPPGEKDNRVAILNQPVDYAATYDGTKYYAGLRAIQSPGPIAYAAINMPPEAFDLSIVPEIPGAASTLTRRYFYKDPEGDPEVNNGTRIRWYKNGSIQPAYNDKATVSSSAITAGDTWYFTVQPDDGNSLGLIAASPSVTIRDADLGVSNHVDNNSPDEGDTITYTVAVVNNGPDNATNIEITHLLPPGITHVSDDANGDYSSSGGLWIVGDLNSGDNAILTVIAIVDLGACADNLSSIASITAVDQADPYTSNNSDSAEIAMQCADLAVVSSVDNESPNEGDTIIYTVTVTNNGTNNASNVEITDLLPPEITYVSDNAHGRYDSNIGIWTVGHLDNGDSIALVITATVDTGIINEDTCGVPITNTAAVTALDQNDPDSENNSDSVDVSVPCADLEVSNSVDDPAPNDGDTITYTVTVTNNGADAATNVEIIDQLPPEATYSTAVLTQGRLSYASADAQVIWNVGDLPNGANATLTIKATVNIGIVDESTCGVPGINTASIIALDQKDPNGENNSASAEIMAPCADLAVNSKMNDSSPDAGDAVTYTVTVTNNGPGNATNVVIIDQLPSEVIYISNSPSQGSYNSGGGQWTVGDLNSGASAALAITVAIDEDLEDTIVTYTASITAADQADPNIDNNSTSVSFIGSSGKADLAVNVRVDNKSPNEGDTITYTITITNNGPGEATGAVVTHLMPSKLAYVSDSPSQGSYNSDKGEWAIGDLPNGSLATLAIATTVDASACADTITNIVILTAMDQADSYVNNNNDRVDITVQCADLAVNMSVDNDTPSSGDSIVYTTIVTNNGIDNATNVEVAVLLSLEVISATVTQGSYDNNGVWTLGDLNSGISAILMITAAVDTDTCAHAVASTARIIAADQADPDTSNNSDSVDVAMQCADLAVDISVDNETPNEGDTLVYTVTVLNNGSDNATNVKITDQLPPGITYVSDDANGGYDSNTGLWTIGDLNSGDRAVLTIAAIVDSNDCAHIITNTASITAVDQGDPDMSNNSHSVEIILQCADLAISNVVDNDFPNEGDTISYTITVTNNGNGDATSVEITDMLPSGVTYISDIPSQGSYDSGQGVWTVGDLNSGADATLIITATVDAGTGGTTIKNSASITGVDQVDPDDTNNMFSASLTSVKLKLISASYEAMKPQLTLVFNDAIDLEQAYFHRIGIEIDGRLSQDFSLSDDQDECPIIALETPYEDNGIMLYPVTMNIQCEVATALSLAISAFVTSPAGAIDLVLEPGAFTDTSGGQSPAAHVPLSITANGLHLRTKGDLSGDGEITAHDARLILQYIVHGESSLPIYETVAELEGWLKIFWPNEDDVDIIGYLANTDGQPRITANDAAMALRFSAGLMDSFCESCAPIASMTRRNGRLTASRYEDGKLEISVDLDDVSDVYSADIVITYDPQALTLTDVSASEWLSEHAITPGKLRISLAGAYQPEDGSLVTLNFHATSADAIRKLNLAELKLNGGELRTSIQNLPRAFALLQNYPNPFNPETWVPYHLSEPANVTVTIYNMTGQIVRRLELGNRMPGSYVERSKAAYWDGRNEAGEKVSSGIYFYQLQADQNASIKKMTIAE